MAKLSLAVKYRPRHFSDLTEQSTIKDILVSQIETKTFQHAYLFTGPAGTGKTTSARIFANMINGEGKSDIIEIDAASNSGVEKIRTVIDDSKKRSIVSEYKVYIIDECHSLSNEAWQAMLKLLEESPKYSVFILCTTDPQKIPATIMSRVQRYQFNKISVTGIVDRLRAILVREDEEVLSTGGPDCVYTDSCEPEALEYIAKLANGGMRDAITLMDKCLSLDNSLTLENVLSVVGTGSYDTFFDMLRGLLDKSERPVEIIDETFAAGKDVKLFMKEFTKFVLDVEKYVINPVFTYITIPQTYESGLNEIKENHADRLPELLELVFNINNQVKWDNDPKTMIELMLLIYKEK
jgi:DNA polymerase-3 subunit gamma/tau